MYILWLVLMALFIGYLAVPLAREVGYSYGRFGRLGDILAVLLGALLFGVLFVAVLAAIGAWAWGETGALVLGFIGALLAIILLTIFSVSAAPSDEDPQTG